MTGRDLVSASLRLIGALAPGESLDATEATDGLASINRLLDSWSNEGLLVEAEISDIFTLIPGTTRYTYGTGGTFNSARPIDIESVLLRVSTGSLPIDYPVRMLSLDQYSSLVSKSTTGSIITDIFVEGTYPLETVNVFPNPTTAHSLVFFSKKPLTQITDLDTAISFQPGFERALVYNGAIELSSEYGKVPNELVFKIANDSKAVIKTTNHKSSYLRVDDALIENGKFNILTGGYNK